ncbi:MAG TPA: lysylphosphatidylglycerol synthase transmembrane domain-containing protein [Gaiellaceae bacterium]|nr:lysylphosphatidylglycerol synthase transmembrane domain-containing protein [Gaiellaceae bacterium]
MSGFVNAVESFFDQLTSIALLPLALAILCHLGRIVARSRAWRNVVAAAYPESKVRRRDIFCAYAAGIGANALLPGRGGDLLRLYIARHRVEGSSYPTLASSLLVETIFDSALGLLLLGWALSAGVLPGAGVLPDLPGIDWLWVFHNPRAGAGILFLALVISTILAITGVRKVTAFWARVRQGLSILREPRRYLRQVAAWQALDWAFRLAAIYFALRAFGMPSDLHSVLVVQVAQTLSTLLPLTPAGIGTEQALLVYMFAGTAPASAVLSFSVGLKIVVITVNLTLGTIATLAILRKFPWHVDVDEEAAERA